MDFEAENWDVGKEASELDKSLFQKNKTNKRKNGKKRKGTEIVTLMQDDEISKRRKLSSEENDKFEKPKTSMISVAVSDSEVSGTLTRKEKRDKKWQEKILRRKEMSEMKGSNVSNSSSEEKFGSSKKNANISQNNYKLNEVLTPDSSSMSRAEKRKLKWEKMQENKKLREKQTNIKNKIKQITELNQDCKSASKVNNGGNISEAGKMNRKERRKLQWKQKLKERKLSHKNEKENDTEISDKNNFSKETEHNIKNDLIFKIQNEKKQEVKSKKTKRGKEGKSISPDESKEMNCPKTKDIQVNENVQTGKEVDSLKKKKKRKRICKRNKFKGYDKLEIGSPKPALDDGKSSADLTSPEILDKSMGKETIETEKSTSLNNVSTEKNKLKKKLMKGKAEKNSKELNGRTITAVESEKDLMEIVSDNTKCLKKNVRETVVKKSKKSISFDPDVLRNILSPGKEKIISSNNNRIVDKVKTENKNENRIVDKDKTENKDVVEEVSGFSRQKKGEIKGKTLLEKSRERLNAARFRYLNEQLYTTTGQEAFRMFKNDDVAFSVYHEGFQSQVEKWPTNPIDVIIEKIQAKPKHLILADFGCGDAKLARSVPNKVHSFDLVALNDHVTVCDMSKVPVKDSTVDIAVFCLSLMGTNLASYLKEANRILKNNGTLMIAEVSSRFHSIGSFVLKVEKMGFKIKNQDAANKMFVMMEFKKTAECKDKNVEDIELKPCVYKKR